MAFQLGVGADDVKKPSNGGITVGSQVVNNHTKALLQDGGCHLESMQKLYVKRNVDWIQQRILVFLIIRRDGVAISEGGGIEMGNLSNEAKGIVCRNFTFWIS